MITFEEQLSRLKEAGKEYEFSQEAEDAVTRLRERKPMPVINYDTYDGSVLYCPIFKSTLENSDAPKDSLLYLLTLLSAQPKKIDLKKKPHYTQGADGNSIYHFDAKEKFLDNAIDLMLEFINLAAFLLHHLQDKQELREDLSNMLIVAAANEYNQLFSSRGKNEFAYYVARALDHCNDESFYGATIDPYDPDKWRNKFRRMTQKARNYIQAPDQAEENMYTILISNVVMTVGIMPDPIDKQEKGFFEIGIYTDIPVQQYDRILVTPFDLD